MKKLLLALTAVAVFSGSALAADLAPAPTPRLRPPVKAPSWTGFYIFGGGGGGIWDADNHNRLQPGPISNNQRTGGDGWFGTVGAGYDWQFNGSWVAGIFADGSSAASLARSTIPFNTYRKRKASGRLGGWRAVGLSGRSECPVLRQRRLYRLVLVGLVSRWACGRPISRDDTVVQS